MHTSTMGSMTCAGFSVVAIRMAVGNVYVTRDRAEINIVEAQAESQVRRHAC